MRDVIVVVLGWNYSTSLGVVRSLGRAGYHVELFYIAKKNGDSAITASSKYLKRTIEHIGRDDEAIIAILQQEYGHFDVPCVLVPTDDYTSSLLDRYYDRLTPGFRIPHIGKGRQGAITHLMNKSVQATLAQDSGLKTIGYHEIFISEDENIVLPEGIRYPCFVKPLVSLDGRKTEMKKCDSEEQLRTHIYWMKERKNNRKIIVQDFLDIQEEFSISGVCLDQTVLIPALLKRIHVGRHERGVTIVGELVEISTELDFQEKIELFLKSLNYTGLFCMDLIKTLDAVYLSEINFRSAGSLYGYVRAGANLPDILVSVLIGKTRDLSVSVKMGTRFFYDKVGWEDLMHGYCTLKDFRRYMRESDFSLMKDDMDPTPGRLLYRKMIGRYWMNKVRTFIKR